MEVAAAAVAAAGATIQPRLEKRGRSLVVSQLHTEHSSQVHINLLVFLSLDVQKPRKTTPVVRFAQRLHTKISPSCFDMLYGCTPASSSSFPPEHALRRPCFRLNPAIQ